MFIKKIIQKSNFPLLLLNRRTMSIMNTTDICADNLSVSTTLHPKKMSELKELVFGKEFSDHMLLIEYADGHWSQPKIVPYGPLSLEPSCTVFHYGVECFEGMKAYKDTNSGHVRMFRPNMNMDRLHRSCQRLALPTFNKDELLKCIKLFINKEHHWIPQAKGYSLYVRPTVIATQPTLGVNPSSKALMYVIASPVGPYFKSGFTAVSLLAQSQFVRAWPGGTGEYKIGGNYAPGILPQVHANSRGYQQILWLYGPKDEITEVGTMNFFMYWINEHGRKELVTPPLDGTILPGVTRDSILQLTSEWREFEVTERKVFMHDLVTAHKESRILELFGAGTACIVSPIKNVHYNGHDYAIPLNPDDSNAQAGPLAKRLNDHILAIQYGEVKHDWSIEI